MLMTLSQREWGWNQSKDRWRLKSTNVEMIWMDEQKNDVDTSTVAESIPVTSKIITQKKLPQLTLRLPFPPYSILPSGVSISVWKILWMKVREGALSLASLVLLSARYTTTRVFVIVAIYSITMSTNRIVPLYQRGTSYGLPILGGSIVYALHALFVDILFPTFIHPVTPTFGSLDVYDIMTG